MNYPTAEMEWTARQQARQASRAQGEFVRMDDPDLLRAEIQRLRLVVDAARKLTHWISLQETAGNHVFAMVRITNKKLRAALKALDAR